jgi:hypothetical protein
MVKAMDGTKVDLAARLLASGASRRSVVGALLAGAISARAVRADRGVCAQETCDPPCDAGSACVDGVCCVTYGSPGCTTPADCCNAANLPSAACCDGVCALLTQDSNHCGVCGASCDEATTCRVCVEGACVSLCGPCHSCDQGQCVSDCDETEVCEEGVCVVSACQPICDGASRCCDGNCVAQNDPANCGACGIVCDLGACEECEFDGEIDNFRCQSRCGQGGEGPICCAGVCRDLSTDVASCGACDNPCGPTETCVDGACREIPCDPSCPAGTTCCDGRCFDTARSGEHCGGCHQQCFPEVGPGCCEGVCLTSGTCLSEECPAPCEGGLHCCGGRCVDTQTDPLDCGGCSFACGVGQVCVAGQCAPAEGCADGLVLCGQACVDLASDEANCGACGAACASGETCLSGVCTGDGTTPQPTPTATQAEAPTQLPSTGSGRNRVEAGDGRWMLALAGGAAAALLAGARRISGRRSGEHE